MLNCIIKTLFILLSTIYIFYKLLNISPATKYKQTALFFFTITTGIFTSVLFPTYRSINWFFALCLLFIMLKFLTKIGVSVIYTTLLFSFSLSFISFSVSGIIVSLILSPFFYNIYTIPWTLIHLSGGLLHLLIIKYYFFIPRLRKGMIFLYHMPSGNIGSTFCVLLITLTIIFNQTENSSEILRLIFFSLVLISGFLLIYWWNYHITQTYRKYLKKNEIDSLNLLLEEKNREITYLSNENDKLARLIHKDNKLLPALSMAVIESLENGTTLDLSSIDCDSSLHNILKQLYDERVEMLTSYEKGRLKLPETRFNSTNAVLSYMQNEALKSKISYQVMLFDDLTSTIPNKITEDDFTHMLSDLLANSLNACMDTDSAFIQIYLGIIDGISTIKIYNNGKKFSMETLQKLGLARHTTHASTGGSGIGLMDIWRLKEKYKATLLIDEITNKDSDAAYTCINILFNHKNHFIVQSDRHKELSNYINRPDIMILSNE